MVTNRKPAIDLTSVRLNGRRYLLYMCSDTSISAPTRCGYLRKARIAMIVPNLTPIAKQRVVVMRFPRPSRLQTVAKGAGRILFSSEALSMPEHFTAVSCG